MLETITLQLVKKFCAKQQKKNIKFETKKPDLGIFGFKF